MNRTARVGSYWVVRVVQYVFGMEVGERLKGVLLRGCFIL